MSLSITIAIKYLQPGYKKNTGRMCRWLSVLVTIVTGVRTVVLLYL